jgi:hypothetical protein
MKLPSTKAHGVLLIAAVNLAAAVGSIAIAAFGTLSPCSSWPQDAFRVVTFPILLILASVSENMLWWIGSFRTIAAFYALLVINAFVWGVIGMRLLCWWHRTFWIMPGHPRPYDEADLRVSVRRAIVLHCWLLLLLLLCLRHAVFLFIRVLLPDSFSGSLPYSLELLLGNTQFLFGAGLWYSIPVWAVLLWLDAKAYRHLYITRGRRAAQRWSLVVVLLRWHWGHPEWLYVKKHEDDYENTQSHLRPTVVSTKEEAE